MWRVIQAGAGFGNNEQQFYLDSDENIIIENNTLRIIGTIHTLPYNHNKGTQKSGGVNDSTIYSEYHKYSIEWLPDRIKWNFDDNLYYTYKPSNYLYNES